MIRKKKLYAKPRKPFEKSRIEEENVLLKKYALKNKREIWKALAKVNYFRRRAMALAGAHIEQQENFFNKLKALGLGIKSRVDILDLELEDLLKRRLATIVAQKGLANTAKQARQMITHKRILVNGKTVTAPSYIVSISEENTIVVKQKNKTAQEEKVQEIKMEEK